MPIIKSEYTASGIFKNAHVSSIYAATLRKVDFSFTAKNRIELSDGDFLDLERSFYSSKNNKIVILLHGLAGNANRPYMLGMAKHFQKNGWDVASMNFRSCSGEMNRLYRSYHAGATKDLEAIINHLQQENRYKEIALVGFSLGGNLMLKYLGEQNQIPSEIKSAVAVSTPCDLGASLEELDKTHNFLYSKRFIKNLKKELQLRQTHFPSEISKEEIKQCNSLLAIDELYTSRAHGFKDASDYYKKCSCIGFLPEIKTPTLLLNAQNDTFLSPNSYPIAVAKHSEFLHLEIPKHGGHVGFFQSKKPYYHEQRALEFITERKSITSESAK
ncbi:alpha/beta fold hydrolase [Salegentibacter sp. JZCK2]|uniref:YheT family hydrolase n=1 Tax=Salegentibacter tibetensis TaxID=2873600 RepID=UPI001CCAA6CA|nr:alpha/beta fold hydrolase [Salegentibacter tibetensis]MBZ9729922.1 alpha/beta fold hydrolase [Salegentibacter tibetensis]